MGVDNRTGAFGAVAFLQLGYEISAEYNRVAAPGGKYRYNDPVGLRRSNESTICFNLCGGMVYEAQQDICFRR